MIIWISSYPKSGNTWLRAFLSAYLYSSDGLFNFNLLNQIGEFPDHNILGKFMNNKDFHNLGEVSKNWIKTQEFINLNNKNTFLKTHSALCNINGNVFTNKLNSLAFIYIVRDPRNVILSMSNHFGISQEESLNILINERYIIYPEINKTMIPATLVGSWGNNYKSWKNHNSINKIIIKYEDLINNTEETFKKVIKFLKVSASIDYNKDKLINSIRSTQFDSLQKHEDQHGFQMGQKSKFFHLGKKNDWKNLLDPKINIKVNSKFKSEMSELNYI
jgi:hypothetical protein